MGPKATRGNCAEIVWEEALAEALAPKPGERRGMSTSEIAAATGRPHSTIVRALRTMKARGLPLRVRRELRESIDGRMLPVPVFWLDPPRKAARKRG